MNTPIAFTLLLCIIPALAACGRSSETATSSHEPTPSSNTSNAGVVSTPQVPAPLVSTARGWMLPASDAQAGWHPTRRGVEITPGATSGAFAVSYTRDKGTTSGAAFMLPDGATSSLKSIMIKGSASPDQRLYVCITDAQGIVWTFPTMRLTASTGTVELAAADIGPDPYQNAGKTPPAAPDWSTMKMLTILDISAHMGAPAVDCKWTIESVEGVLR